jgi:hypothetical protein
MHIAMSAAVNNDTLAELMLATILLLAVRYLKLETAEPGGRADTRLLVLLGVTTGLALVTKSSIYIALPLVLLAIAVKVWWLEDGSFWQGVKAAAVYLLPAVALALPWWLRNLAIYGGTDFLGLTRHNAVVAGQLTTAEFVAGNGLRQLLLDFFLTSFRSFWGQFGWMGVLLDQRIYQALGIVSALAVVGFALWAVRTWHARAQADSEGAGRQWAAGSLLLASGGLTLASYAWYNTQFLQHQGRYLFTALVPISLAVALGWREALRRERALLLAALLLSAAAILRLAGLLPNWPLLMLIAAAFAFAARRFLPARWDPAIQAVPYLLLIPLDLACLFLFVVPQLKL